VRLRLFLLLSLTVLAVVGATVVIYDRLESFNAPSDQVVGPGADDEDATGAALGSAGDGGTGPGEVGDAGEAGVLGVEGTVTAVHLEGAVLDPATVPTPLTLVSDRGFGNGAEITGVTVEGRESTIVWDGGRPFVLSSGPGLVLGAAAVDLTEEGLRVVLGGGTHGLEPGTYRLNTPVAVGDRGVATPRDAVTFVAGDDARLDATGDTALLLGATDGQSFVGPGSVHLEGELVIEQAEGTQPATSLDLTDNPFDLEFSAFEGGRWTVSGRVESNRVGDLVLGSARHVRGPALPWAVRGRHRWT
jgi:hypothetical protein